MIITLLIPNGWDEFVEKTSKLQNLLIKKKGECVCTNCKHIFHTKKKVGEKAKCPNCKNTYLIKQCNLKNYYFEDDLGFLELHDGIFVLRLFELASSYNNTTKYYGFNNSIVEYARIFIDEPDATFVNDRVSKCQCYIHVNHLSSAGNWRQYTRHYSLINKELIFPNNLKAVFKDTQYQYSFIWDLIKHLPNCYINFEQLMRDSSRFTSMEFLIKLGLYNLALNPNHINSGKNFESRFGVSKEFYPFMKRYNITSDELDVLKLYKKPNIKVIRHIAEQYSYNRIEELCNYTTIDKLLEYEKMTKRKVDIYTYVDYLENAKLLGYNLKSKRYLFPKNLGKAHDRLVKKVEDFRNEIYTEAVLRRYDELSQNIYKTKKYIIIPPKTKEDFISEASQQGNCVYTNYYRKHASGQCDIYFMRKVNSLNKSLVTVEVRNNKVVQSRIKGNDYPDKSELDFLKLWERKVLNKEVA